MQHDDRCECEQCRQCRNERGPQPAQVGDLFEARVSDDAVAGLLDGAAAGHVLIDEIGARRAAAGVAAAAMSAAGLAAPDPIRIGKILLSAVVTDDVIDRVAAEAFGDVVPVQVRRLLIHELVVLARRVLGLDA